MGTAIESGLGVAKYNQSNPDSQIKIGDRIVTLNGEKATMKTVREYEGGNNENTTLGIKRPEPAAPVASAPQQMVMGSNKPVGVPADAEFIKETFAGQAQRCLRLGVVFVVARLPFSFACALSTSVQYGSRKMAEGGLKRVPGLRAKACLLDPH